jgi:hypothetical protein
MATRPTVRIAPRPKFITKETFIVLLLAVGKNLKSRCLFLFHRAALPRRPDAMDVYLGVNC